jgi:S-adenosylmethionine synthetase
MSLEAAAGKNPASHVGKLCNVLAHRLATPIQASVDDADEVIVRLLSGIGRPIDQPRLVAIDVVAERGLSSAQEQHVRERASCGVQHSIPNRHPVRAPMNAHERLIEIKEQIEWSPKMKM